MNDINEILDKQPDGPEIERLKAEIRKLNKRLRSHQGLTHLVYDAVAQSLIDYVPATAPPRPRTKRRKNKEIAVVHVSDWQIGALTTNFDTDIAWDRVKLLTQKVNRVIERRRAHSQIDTCHVFVGGDMVDGSAMRADHPWAVDSTVLAQATDSCPSMIASLVLSMLETFPKVAVTAVRGNHGRSGPRKGDTNPKSVNWDTVAAKVARLMLQHIPSRRLTFDVAEEDWCRVVQIGETGVLLIHGDQFRGSGGFAGIPYYAIAKKMARWQNLADLPKWDVLMFGHYHVPASGMFNPRMWYLNGTLKSGGEWEAEELGESPKPAQRLLIFDEERGPIADHILWLNN